MPHPNDLTTLDAVRAEQQKPSGNTDQDAIISTLITQASKRITRYCKREFVATDDASRTFETDLIGDNLLSVAPYDLRAVTAVTIDPDPWDPGATTEQIDLAAGDWRLYPTPAEDGVYGYLLVGAGLGATRGAPNRRYTITGDWGFEEIPYDVERACIVTVNEWLRDRWLRDPGMTAELAAAGMPEIARPSDLPFAARALLSDYRREVV